MKKAGPTFSVKFQSTSRDGASPYPSLLSVETDDRKQFQCVNVVVNGETRGNPTFYRRKPTQQTINFWFRENVVYTIFKANALRGVTVDNFPVVLIFQKKKDIQIAVVML